MTDKPLTHKQSRFLRGLIDYINKEKRPPTVRELQVITGLKSPRSIGQYLDVLEKAGYIERSKGARNIKTLRNAASFQRGVVTTVRVPILGSAPCGAPILAEQELEDYVSVSVKLAKPPARHFILKATGHSMDKAGINDGDMMLVRQQVVAENGQIVAALIDNETTIKRLRFAKDHIVLEPVSNDPEERSIIVERDFQIQGVIVKVLKDL